MPACSRSSARRSQPPLRPILQGTDRLLADLVARRRQLVAMIVAEKNRRENVTGRGEANDRTRASHPREAHRRRLEVKIDALLIGDAERAELLELLQDRARRRPRSRTDAGHRPARTRTPRPSRDRLARRRRTLRARQRDLPRQPPHPRRSGLRPHRPLPRGHDRLALQPR